MSTQSRIRKARVDDENARKYAGFTYRMPVFVPIDTWQLDPERLHPAHAYPRSVNPPSNPKHKAIDVADVAITVGDPGPDGKCLVQVWMLANEHTRETVSAAVFEFYVAAVLMDAPEIYDYALSCVFSDSVNGALI